MIDWPNNSFIQVSKTTEASFDHVLDSLLFFLQALAVKEIAELLAIKKITRKSELILDGTKTPLPAQSPRKSVFDFKVKFFDF